MVIGNTKSSFTTTSPAISNADTYELSFDIGMPKKEIFNITIYWSYAALEIMEL